MNPLADAELDLMEALIADNNGEPRDVARVIVELRYIRTENDALADSLASHLSENGRLRAESAKLRDALDAIHTDAKRLRIRYPDDAFVEAVYCNSRSQS